MGDPKSAEQARALALVPRGMFVMASAFDGSRAGILVSWTSLAVGEISPWFTVVIGAVLLGTVQQVATVTISSAVNLLIVGLMLIGFVILAPNGIVGLFQSWFGKKVRR